MFYKGMLKTVTIGIPAYNEGLNIASLLHSVFSQSCDGFVLEHVIIASDGSTDNTIQQAELFVSQKNCIRILNNPVRGGLAVRQNQIFSESKSDILVLLQADIRISDPDFLNKIIKPIIHDQADLVAANLLPVKAVSFFAKTLEAGYFFKNNVFEVYKDGLNVYTCHGTARAFSKRLYHSLRFSKSIGEDAYSYFYCLKKNFRYFYARDAVPSFRLPESFSDHKKQSSRYMLSRNIMEQFFGAQFVREQYALPLFLLIFELFKQFVKTPIIVASHIFLVAFIYIQSVFFPQKPPSEMWEISKTSKNLS